MADDTHAEHSAAALDRNAAKQLATPRHAAMMEMAQNSAQQCRQDNCGNATGWDWMNVCYITRLDALAAAGWFGCVTVIAIERVGKARESSVRTRNVKPQPEGHRQQPHTDEL